jgi:hypothetical protein
MAKRSVLTAPPSGPTVLVPPELLLVEELLLDEELLLVEELLLDEELLLEVLPQLDGSGGAWHLQVSALHHQPL